MNKEKRILVATTFGFISGLICILSAMTLFNMTFTPLQNLFIISNRLLIGIAIGISGLRLPWVYHGILIGLIFGFPFPVYDLIVGQSIFIATAAYLMSPVFGVFIEYFTTVVFKAGNDIRQD